MPIADDNGQSLAFGIASLDELLGSPTRPNPDQPESEFGIYVEDKRYSTSICLIGPDGTGKSVLALHLAAQYAATADDETRILYASTDLSHAKALSIWQNFALGAPSERVRGMESVVPQGRSRTHTPVPELRVKLDRYLPLIPAHEAGNDSGDLNAALPLSAYLLMRPRRADAKETARIQHHVAFIDLESSTAGDDWGLINRLLATLKSPEPFRSRDMLIIDAVEGLETLGGDRDAFGQERKRRSRIAQILRAAKDKCHVVFIVEEPREHERLPEEFVSDAVIRLRVERQRDYARRTLEIVKVRGQSYVRGRHDCLIRRGTGSKTGLQDNPDDLPLLMGGTAMPKAYFVVFPSLHYLSRVVMEAPRPGTEAAAESEDPRGYEVVEQKDGLCGFGIKYLDELVGDQGRTTRHHRRGRQEDWAPLAHQASDRQGLRWGTVTALIGDEGTHKSRVCRAFLAQAFHETRGRKPGIGLLLSTYTLDADLLALKLLKHLPGAGDELLRAERIRPRLFCRRLEIHHMTPPVLFHIIHSLVQRGLRELGVDLRKARGRFGDPSDPSPGQVRLVIDDWSDILSAYPEVREDPIFLPFLLYYLQRQGITTLISDTEPGRLSQILSGQADRGLGTLVDKHLYTWHVSFFGEKRVAIAALPPFSDDKPVVVRELKPYDSDEEELIIDPHFEYYSGLEDNGPPRHVPLQVRLFSESYSSADYHDEVGELFRQLFGSGAHQPIVRLGSADYAQLRDFAYLQGGSALEHTLVIQVDEFWSQDGDALHDLREYLHAETVEEAGECNPVEDPFRLFQPAESQSDFAVDRRKRQRCQHFVTIGYNMTSTSDPPVPQGKEPTLDRVPFTVDFGFLLGRYSSWRRCRTEKLASGRTVGDVWDALAVPPGLAPHTSPPAILGWRDLFGACLRVVSGGRGGPPFDVDMSTPETLSCLLLEVWFSEVYRGGAKVSVVPSERHDAAGPGLADLIGEAPSEPNRHALYRAWLLLNAVLTPAHFGPEHLRPQNRPAWRSAAAARHWYSTACPAVAENPKLVPLRLPGHYCTRGDWFLGIARGSRSRRLGERAIDLLGSRRSAISRMQLGLGLPARGFPDDMSLREDAEFRSPLTTRDDHGRPQPLRLHQMLWLGALPSLKGVFSDELTNQPHFWWLWRSRLKHYDRQSRILQKWIVYAFKALRDEAAPASALFGNAKTCLETYDQLAQTPADGRMAILDYPAFNDFDRLCTELYLALNRATIRVAGAS